MEDPDQKVAILLDAFRASAAWLDLEAAIKQAESAALRGDVSEIEAHRQRAHDFLDTHMDLKLSAHAAIRSVNES